MSVDFPGNSNKNKSEKSKDVEKKKDVKPVVTGKVIQKKKPFGAKFKEVFLGMELKAATRYIAADVLIPALRNTIVEATTRGIERLIYGDEPPPHRKSGYTSSPRYDYRRGPERFAPHQREFVGSRPRHSAPRRQMLADIILERREDVDNVLERLGDLIDSFDVVSVADLYDLVDIPSTYVDNSWGWTSIDRIQVQQVREGWLLLLPSPEHID